MNQLFLGMIGCASLLVGCANDVIIEQPDPSSGGGNSASVSSSGTGSSSTSGGTTTVCTPKDDGGVFVQPTCKDLDRLVLANSFITEDTDGDGFVEAGETASVTVTMKEMSGLGFNWYPGVEFKSANPAVGVEANSWFYAILPCTEQPAKATMKVAPDVLPGTIVTIRAQIAMLNQKCPDTFTTDIPVTVH